ncbi:MAG: ABATE domain-containing protein, partial [Bradyrhizobium sp.]|nr:ABATE domain-containing protein [Bradyrhizobium sp.]
MLVSMRLSEKFAIPSDFALLYDFVNSLDVRRYVEQGTAHDPSDELATPARLRDWLQTRGLLEGGVDVPEAEHREALEFREALRNFIAVPAQARSSAAGALVKSASGFTLEVAVAVDRVLGLRPVPARATSGLGHLLVELVRLSDDG